MYADDLLLISSSLICLQSMLDICGSERHRLGMSFNAKKSQCIVIGPHWDKNLATLLINGVPINWSEKIPYLGITLLKGKNFTTDVSITRRKFFSSVNCIISRTNYVSELARLYLCEAHCLPILMYAMECMAPNTTQCKDINSW
jgi:hypothetical protein